MVSAQQVELAQTIKLVKVVSKRIVRTTELPGEFYPFLTVELHAKITGYVQKVLLDRGVVAQGDFLVRHSAPKLEAHIT
jgi:membrane fusion protein, multidrug efflux system